MSQMKAIDPTELPSPLVKGAFGSLFTSVSSVTGTSESDEKMEYGTFEYQKIPQAESSAPSNIQRVTSGLSKIYPITVALFINLLDACTFGTIFFPSALYEYSGVGISTFLLSTALVQIIFCGFSGFRAGLGTAMAENIPFLHTVAQGIIAQLELESGESPSRAMPTIMVAFSISTILNGITFLVVGLLRAGDLLHFFPRHVIIGCIGGFGVFLLTTSIEISTGIAVRFENLHEFVTADVAFHWILVVVLQMLKMIVEHYIRYPLIAPLFLMIPPVGFYIVLLAFNIPIEEARDGNWMFEKAAHTKFYQMWELYKFSEVNWGAIFTQSGTMIALALFSLVHVPIRIPTLNLTTGEEVDFNREIRAHGLSNIATGMFGSVHNYLSYSNSVFYFKSGGDGKISQIFVALMTFGMFMIGPSLINYVPRCAAGVVMMTLGTELIWEVYQSHQGLDKFELSSVCIIALTIAINGFIGGIIVGGILACVTFVLQSSRISAVRATFSGNTVRSNTQWPGSKRNKLVSKQADKRIFVIQLQGHLFFANIQQVLDRISEVLASSRHRKSHSPMDYLYLVLDCTFVSGIDANAAASLKKMQDMLEHEDPPVEVAFAGLRSEILAKINEGGSNKDDKIREGNLAPDTNGSFDNVALSARQGMTRVSSFHRDVNSALISIENSIIHGSTSSHSINEGVISNATDIKPTPYTTQGSASPVRSISSMVARSFHEDEEEETRLPSLEMVEFSGELVKKRNREEMLRMVQEESPPFISPASIEILCDEYLLPNVTAVKAGTTLWSAGDEATHACLLLKGILHAVIPDALNPSDLITLQVIHPGTFAGELGLLCEATHSRTIVVVEDSEVAFLRRTDLSRARAENLDILCLLQSVALQTAESRSQELMLFNAGAMT